MAAGPDALFGKFLDRLSTLPDSCSGMYAWAEEARPDLVSSLRAAEREVDGAWRTADRGEDAGFDGFKSALNRLWRAHAEICRAFRAARGDAEAVAQRGGSTRCR